MANSVASVLKNFAARSEIANWNIDGRCAKRPRSALSHWLGGREASILRPPSPNPATGRRHWRLPGNRGSHMISTQNGAFLRGLWRRVGGELREGGGREGGRGDFLFSFLFIFYRPYFIWFIGLLSAMFLGLQYTTSLSPRRPHCLFVCSNSHQMGVASKVGWHKTTVGWYYVSWSLIFSLDISLFDKRLLLHPVRIQSTVAEFFRTRQRVSPHGRWCWLALVALEFYCIGRFVAVWAVIMLNGDA